MEEFKIATTGFNYFFEKTMATKETIILKMPPVSPNKRSVSDIGWQSDGNAILYGTVSSNPESDNAIWQKIKPNEDVNKTISAIKIVNKMEPCNVVIRVIFN